MMFKMFDNSNSIVEGIFDGQLDICCFSDLLQWYFYVKIPRQTDKWQVQLTSVLYLTRPKISRMLFKYLHWEKFVRMGKRRCTINIFMEGEGGNRGGQVTVKNV